MFVTPLLMLLSIHICDVINVCSVLLLMLVPSIHVVSLMIVSINTSFVFIRDCYCPQTKFGAR